MTKPTIQFGDKDSIRLLELGRLMEGAVAIEYKSHECDCEFCDMNMEKCPKCLAESEAQFEEDGDKGKCKDCGAATFDPRLQREADELRKKLNLTL